MFTITVVPITVVTVIFIIIIFVFVTAALLVRGLYCTRQSTFNVVRDVEARKLLVFLILPSFRKFVATNQLSVYRYMSTM